MTSAPALSDLRTVTDHQRAFADGLTVAEVAAEVRRRQAALDDPAVFIGGLSADLERQATELDRLSVDERLTRPLFGIPFAVKDNIDVAGGATTAGCPAFASTPAGTPALTATAVQRLLDAGALYVGKTNLDQFATGLVGTRTPYGVARNVIDPDLVPGGSSSGSAVAVAAGVVVLALGTDTAGSGRVPAAMNQIVGLKPTRGLVSAAGVVPACASLDCVSVFAPTVADAVAAFDVLDALDPADPRRRAQADRAQRPLVRPDRARIGVLAAEELATVEADIADSYRRMLDRLAAVGATLVEVDLGPFLAAGVLLYGDALVAERYAAVGAFVESALVESTRSEVVEVTGRIIVEAGRWSAADYQRAQAQVLTMRSATAVVWGQIDALALPTVPRTVTVAEALAQPLTANQALGRYTTFTNVLDLAAITIPGLGPDRSAGAGLSLQGPAGSDLRLAALAGTLTTLADADPADADPFGGGLGVVGVVPGTIDVTVVGAHLEGQPLNSQLTELGATLVAATTTGPCYRLWALADGRRPALERVADGTGAAIEVEVWSLPEAAFGALARQVAPPLALGTVVLADGTTRPGFVCELGGLDGAVDITVHGGWRRWLQVRPA